MKKLQQIILLFLAVTISTTTQAQLGGLLKKIKDKVAEKKAASIPDAAKDATNITSKTDDQEFYFYGERFGFGENIYTIAKLKEKKIVLNPYTPVRKKEETGAFHFAKDYPELATVTAPLEDEDLTITFSKQMFTGNNNAVSNSFSSSEGLYAKVSTKKGTLKDALKIGDNNDAIEIHFTLYDDINNKIIDAGGAFLTLTKAQANSKSITIDILPELSNISAGKPSNFHAGSFAYKHDQYTFKQNGKYNVAVWVTNELMDDYGKPILNSDFGNVNFFEYNFSAKDVETVKANYNKAKDIVSEGVKQIPVPLPETWKAKSGAPMAGYSVAKYNQEYLKYYPSVKIVKTFMKDDATWSVMKDNDNFLPIYKYSNQWVTYFVKNTKGQCYYHKCNLRQDYQGGGTYGGAALAVFDSEIKYVDCNEMK
jgi:hypothetical protein